MRRTFKALCILVTLSFATVGCGGGGGGDSRDAQVESWESELLSLGETPIEEIPASGGVSFSGYFSGSHEYTGVDRRPAYADVSLAADFTSGRVSGVISNFTLYSPDGPYSPPIVFRVDRSSWTDGITGNSFHEALTMDEYRNTSEWGTEIVNGSGQIWGTFHGDDLEGIVGFFRGTRRFSGDVLFPISRDISGTIVAKQ